MLFPILGSESFLKLFGADRRESGWPVVARLVPWHRRPPRDGGQSFAAFLGTA